jgi:hypothetical protein
VVLRRHKPFNVNQPRRFDALKGCIYVTNLKLQP